MIPINIVVVVWAVLLGFMKIAPQNKIDILESRIKFQAENIEDFEIRLKRKHKTYMHRCSKLINLNQEYKALTGSFRSPKWTSLKECHYNLHRLKNGKYLSD